MHTDAMFNHIDVIAYYIPVAVIILFAKKIKVKFNALMPRKCIKLTDITYTWLLMLSLCHLVISK